MAGRLSILLIRFYQRWISPALPRACRYHPTCSEYAVESIRTRGAPRGILMAAWRILRCNPFSRGGFDPVPPAGPAQGPESVRRCGHGLQLP